MRELELDFEVLGASFALVQTTPYVLIEVSSEHAEALATDLGTAVRRCYVADEKMRARNREASIAMSDFVRTKIPDLGSVMAGDFGEIITALFQAAEAYPQEILDPKKWRLKQDRTKPAPHSDVVQFVLPHWPTSSGSDRLLCSEVKTKSTKAKSDPIGSAIVDSKKDREGRLAKTLIWLRERALDTDLGTVSIAQLNRFIEAVDHPPAERQFRAVAVICSDLVQPEIQDVQTPPPSECALVVISFADLKDNYEELYKSVVASVAAGIEEP